eukprot:TCALIF_05303-PC protein Name:"Protein of unknown function" AED:0.14 eAED:0.14 QI:0/0.8/0.83/0.83/0.6/0.66/6/6400/45
MAGCLLLSTMITSLTKKGSSNRSFWVDPVANPRISNDPLCSCQGR